MLAALLAAVMVLLWQQPKPVSEGGSGQTSYLAAHEADGPMLEQEVVPSPVGPRVQARIKPWRAFDLHAATAAVPTATVCACRPGPARCGTPVHTLSPLSDRLLRGPPARA